MQQASFVVHCFCTIHFAASFPPPAGGPLPAVYPSAVCRPSRRADPSGVPAPPAVPRPLTPPFPRPRCCKQFTFQSYHLSTCTMVHFPLIATTTASSKPSPSSNHLPYPNSPQALALSLFLFLFLVSFLLLSFSPCSSAFARTARHTNWRFFVRGVLIFFCVHCDCRN